MLFWFLKLAIEGSAMAKKIAVKQKTARKQAPSRTPATAATKKPQPKAARPAVHRAAVSKPGVQKPADAQAVYQFDIATFVVPRIVATKARRSPSPAEFASFNDAKDRAIDFLIDFITDCEQQLWDLKRSENYEAYAAFLAADESRKTCPTE
jgi:hypothetical protein